MVLEKAEVIDDIKKQLSVRVSEKQDLGEVFTPPEMIEDLLDQFPASVWKSKTATFLDPATGTGNFPVFLFYKLLDSLSSQFSSKEKCAEHILREMMYMVEYNPENVKKTKAVFQTICPSVSINILEADFLEHVTSQGFSQKGWPTQFTVVIGNPPYNIGGTKREGKKRSHVAFTEAGLQCLDTKGYVSFICPPSYREADTTMNRYFKEAKGHFVFIRIYGPNETYKLFKIQGRVDSFIYQKGVKGETHICDEYTNESTFQLNLDRHLPNFGYSIFEKLYKAVDTHGHIKGFRTTELTTLKKNTYGCGTNKLLHLITEKGKRIFLSKKKHSLLTTPKLFINGLGIPYVFYDKTGEYGATQTPILIENPTKAVVEFMTSPLYQFVAWGLRLTGNNNLPYSLDAVPNLKSGTLESIYKELHLTAKEIKFIEDEFAVPTFQDKDLPESCRATRKQEKSKSGSEKSKTKKRRD